MCDRCKDENEDIMHAVWGCKGLDGVWGADSTWSFRNQRSFSSFSEFLCWVLKFHKNPVMFAFTMWSIWHQRNQIRTQNSHRPLSFLFQWARDNYLEFKALKLAPVPCRAVRKVRWKPLDPGLYKINFDGATFANDNCSGLGVIVRDGAGLVIAAMATRVPQLLQAIEIEALAANKALEFTQEMDLVEVVLEGDSSLVMVALNSKKPVLAPYSLMIQDSLSLSSAFSKLSYSHTEREGNTVAHNLTQLAVNVPNCVIWMEDVPPDVVSCYQADLAGIS